MSIAVKWFFITSFIIALSACSLEDESSDAQVPEPSETLTSANISIGGSCDENAELQTVSFAHVADLHANFALQERKFEKLKYFYQQIKQNNPYTIFTNAGDDYEKGSVTEALSSGKSVKEAIFAMEFDVRTIGNHDFAWGSAELLEYVQDPHAKVLASNTEYIGEEQASFGTYDFVTAQVGCVNVGFFGMVSLPWNELDETYDGHFLPEVINDFSYRDISQEIILNFRSQVDILVLVSHLGIVEDGFLADSILGIDLVLGGHSHTGVIEETIGESLVIQPEFFADGISQIDIEYDLVNKEIKEINHQAYYTEDMSEYDTELAQTLDEIADKYAPTRHDTIGYAEVTADDALVASVSLQAVYTETAVDAVLLNPNLVWTAWEAGDLSQQSFYDAYNVERQKSDTPGFNSIYRTSITGAVLKAMKTQQPLWLYEGIEELNDETVYTVALNKGPAINIPAFFTDDIQYITEAVFVNENWQILADYAENRTAQCLYLDSDNTIISCEETEYVLFDFNSETTPLTVSQQSSINKSSMNKSSVAETKSELTAYDPSASNWFVSADAVNTPTHYGIDQANTSTGKVLKFEAYDETQGLTLTHSIHPNGSLLTDNKLSYYTLIFDLYVPTSDEKWLAILQTDISNTLDAKLYVRQEDGLKLGIGRYFSGIKFDTWQRISAVVNTNDKITNLYIDGALIGSIDHEDESWALSSSFLLFTDDNAETAAGYIDNLLLVNKPLTDAEVQAFGDASQVMSVSLLPTGLNE